MAGSEGNTTRIDKFKERLQRNYISITLILSFVLSLFLSSFYILGVAVRGNFAVSGGSDAYYNMRIVQYILETHHQLLFDPLLNYPIGLENPRPPFFHWLAVLLGYGFSPFLGGIYKSTMTMFLLETSIGGAFIVFPTYLLGKEVFNKKVGLIGAILAALSPLTLMKSVASIGLFDIFTALFAVAMIYFYLKAVDTYKESEGDTILSKFRNSFKTNKISLLYSLLGGASLAGSMLTWVGTISIILIIAGVGVIQLIINTIKRKGSMGILYSAIFYSEGLLLSLPWYYETGFLDRWVPVAIIWLLLIISAIFLITLDRKPWVLSLGSYIILLLIAIVIIYFKDNSLLQNIISGQHYFIKNKIYNTIAEAQALPLGEDIMEFDPFMFFASLVGIGILIYKWIKSPDFKMTLILFYSAGIIFISMIASKFLYFGASATGILTAFVLYEAFNRLGWHETIDKIKGREVSRSSLRELRISQIAVILMVIFLLIVPATFYAIDSGIPYNNKTQYDRQIYNATPSFLRPANYTPPYYLGAFGVSLDLPNSAWVRALDWFKNQDAQYPPNERPAFISWWDYGFQTLEQGQHPVLADNFQDGIYPSAQILMAQNESEIIAVMIARILDYYNQNNQLNNSTLQSVITEFLGPEAMNKIINYEKNGPSYIPQIYANESYYGPYQDIQAGDAKYILIEHYLANTYPLNTLIDTYQALENISGFYMSYLAVDYRLFPFSGVNTGIFYAPAYLGDFQYIDVQGEIVPIDFYNITVTDINGNTYPLQDFPPGDTATSYNINYQPMFYNSTIYRVFIGYPPSVVGASNAIPGISSSLKYYYPMQAWGMPNFELVYKTVFWNPYTDYQNHSNAWQPVSLQQGYYYLVNHIGTVDLNPPASSVLPNDVVFVEYYPGAIIQGRVTDSSGMPVAGVRVTIDDQYGIPHETVVTNSSGYYQLYAVAGNDTIIISTGSYNALFMEDNNILQTYNITITQAQANREAYSSGGQPDWIITKNFQINSHTVSGTLFFNLAATNFFIPNTDVPVNGELKFYNSTENYSVYVNTTGNGSYSITDLPPYQYEISAYVDGYWYNNVANVTINSNSTSKDIPVPFAAVKLNFIDKFQNQNINSVTISRTNFTTTLNTTNSSSKIFLPTGLFNISASNGPYRYSGMVNISNKKNVTLNITYERFYFLNISLGQQYKLISATYQDMLNTSYSGVLSIEGNAASAYLPPSIYLVTTTVVRNGNYYMNMTTVTLNSSIQLSPILSRGAVFSGTVYIGNKTASGVPVQIMGNGLQLEYTTNPNGTFTSFIPYGSYDITAYFTRNGSTYVSESQVSVFSPYYNQSIYALPGYTITGHIYNSQPGIITAYSGQQEVFYEVMQKGSSYEIYLENGSVVSNIIYKTIGFSYSQSNLNITLHSSPVISEIKLLPDFNYNFTIYLNGPANYVLNFTKYTENLTLLPGNYTLKIDGPGIIATSPVTQIDVLPRYNYQIFEIPVNVYANLNVNTNGNVQIYSQGKLIGSLSNITLTPGTYTVYTNYYNTANITTINLTRNTTLYPVMHQAYFLSIHNSISSLAFVENNSNLLSSSAGIYLPIGEYYVYASQKINASYEIFASEIISMFSQNTIYLNGTLKHLMSNVTINGLVGNEQVKGGYINIQPNNITIPFGTSVRLSYGNYSIYAYQGGYSFVGSVNISTPFENVTIQLRKAYPLVYNTFLNNSSYNSPIYLGGKYKFYIPSNGVLYVPNGTYIFYGNYYMNYYGRYNEFILNQQVNVSGTTYSYLQFVIVKKISVSIIPEGGQLTGYPGQNISFPIIISSNSNIPINLQLTNSSTFNVYTKTLELKPYGTGVINATIGVPKGEPAGTYQIGMNLQYLGNYHQITVNVTVPSIERMNITISNTSGVVIGNTIFYQMTIKNTGNSKIKMNVTILNIQTLTSQGMKVLVNNGTYSNFTILPDQTNVTSIGLSLNYLLQNVKTPIIIGVEFNNNTSVYYLYPSVPGLSFKEITAQGYGIQNYSAVIQYSYLTGTIAFVLVLIVAVMIMVRRRNRT